ncbi:cyclic nucleotide-gated ion channel 1 [Dorcoceras hygrometricum]|nr:cyclic nucleotide-gated ion channel 1 [Dorcoceras hygrometricum]
MMRAFINFTDKISFHYRCSSIDAGHHLTHFPVESLPQYVCVLFHVIMVCPLDVELIQLVVPREMPPRRRGRGRGQIPEESEGQNDEVQRSIPLRRRASQVEVEVDELASRVDDMELVMARFQRMNPQKFNGNEPSSERSPGCSTLPACLIV